MRSPRGHALTRRLDDDIGIGIGIGIWMSRPRMVAQRRALVLRAEHPALLEQRDHAVGEGVEAAGGNVRDEDEAVTGVGPRGGRARPPRCPAGGTGDGTRSALDADRWFVVAPNVLGGCQGSTGPSSPRPGGRRRGGDCPYLTQRHQMLAEAGLANALSVDRWAVVVRGSMGGIRAPEWAVSYPRRADALLPLACPAAAGAEQIAWANIRTQAIRSDPHWRGGDHHDAGPGQGPHTGLGLARRLAHVTCRGEPELAARFGRRAPGSENPWRGGRYLIETEQVTALVREVLPGSDRPGSKAA